MLENMSRFSKARRRRQIEVARNGENNKKRGRVVDKFAKEAMVSYRQHVCSMLALVVAYVRKKIDCITDSVTVQCRFG